MPIWPFRKRRSNTSQPLDEKSTNLQSQSKTTLPKLQRKTSDSSRGRQRRSINDEEVGEAQSVGGGKQQGAALEKEDNRIRPTRKSSTEQSSVLPGSRNIASSPHLRPVDANSKAAIPYNFNQYSRSQPDMQRREIVTRVSQPGTLRSKRSAHGGEGLLRKKSSKKRKNDHLREVEIRAMSAPIPIPKRAGEAPHRQDSKKQRGAFINKDSMVSLPLETSTDSAMAGIAEQQRWEVGGLDVFSPRPVVRLSFVPHHGSPSSVAVASNLSRDGSKTAKDKRSISRDPSHTNKRQVVGDEADTFDASDLRVLLERDAKRKEKREIEQAEKLDQKLRIRARHDNEKRLHRQAEEVRRAEEARLAEQARLQAEEDEQRAEEDRLLEESHARQLQNPPIAPTAIHPALRDEANMVPFKPIGLGIGRRPLSQRLAERSISSPESPTLANTGTYLRYEPREQIPAIQNPFADPAPEVRHQMEVDEEVKQDDLLAQYEPLETQMEDPVLETAQAVRMSQANTPPLSPLQYTQTRATSTVPSTTSALSDLRQERTRSLPEPPPLISNDRRPSDPRAPRAGGWASFFRRGGTNLRKPDDAQSPLSESSFINTSRESMRGLPLPPHLVGTTSPISTHGSRSGTSARTQSKFREDLPEMPISPPDSRVQSPDLPVAAAAAASARRTRKTQGAVNIPEHASSGMDIPHDRNTVIRSDTPVSPSVRGHGLMSGSLASIDSEGSWLAGGPGKRNSGQSGLSRGMGSLSKRKAEWNASYEELGGDTDAEYLNRTVSSRPLTAVAPNTTSHALHARELSIPTTLASNATDPSSDVVDPARPRTPPRGVTVHNGVRRQPTLVKRDPRFRSREGLLTTLQTADLESLQNSPTTRDSPVSPGGGGSITEPDSPIRPIQKATSISYGRGHSRQFSAGSAKLLDMAISKRASVEVGGASRRASVSPRPPQT